MYTPVTNTVFVYCYSWDPELHIYSSRELVESNLILMDTIEITYHQLSEEEIKAKGHGVKLAVAKKDVAKCQAALNRAAEEYRKLLALESK